MYWYYYLIIAICLIFAAGSAAADMVYGVVDHLRLEKEAEKGNKSAKIALSLAKDYDFTISGILFITNVSNIFASSIVTIVGYQLSKGSGVNGELIATIILSVFIIVFCEFVPKIIGKRFNFGLALFFAYPVLILKYITFIFVWPISELFKLTGKLFKKRSKTEAKIDEDVLSEMVDAIEARMK